MGSKGPHVRRLLDQLVGGLAGAVAGARLDADESWLGAEVCPLQRSDVLESVSRHHAIVRVCCRGEDRWISAAGPDVVVGRVLEEVAEVNFLGRRPEFIDPQRSRGELVEAQHVHGPDLSQRRREQVRSLIDRGADQEAAVRRALNGQPVG